MKVLKKMRGLSLIIILIMSITACSSYTYIPDNISNLDSSKLCELRIGMQHFSELAIDDYQYGSLTFEESRMNGFYIKPGSHKLTGYFQEKLKTGEKKISITKSNKSNIKNSQRPRSDTLKHITIKNIDKDPDNQTTTGLMGLGHTLTWYKINFDCNKNTNVTLSDIILLADQMARRSTI